MKSNIENFIGVFDNAFSKEYCDAVIKEFNLLEESGFAMTRQQENSEVDKTQKDDTFLFADLGHLKTYIREFNDTLWGACYPKYADKYSSLKIAGEHKIYGYKVQKTEVGQGYHLWHFESYSYDSSRRILAYALYLNDVEEGGETEFLYYPRRIKPKAGTMVIWPAAFTHTHRGNPPISNTKYIITGWIEY